MNYWMCTPKLPAGTAYDFVDITKPEEIWKAGPWKVLSFYDIPEQNRSKNSGTIASLVKRWKSQLSEMFTPKPKILDFFL